MMNLGIIIVSYNTRELLRHCLVSVDAETARTSDLQVTTVVVDNASADASAEMVARDFPHVHLIASDENLGFARGNNVGFRHLGFGQVGPRPDAVLLLNPDTELHPHALAILTRFLQENPQVGGCCPRLNYGDGSFQHSAFHFPGLIQLYLDLYPIPRLMDTRLNGRYPRSRYDAGQPFAIDFALGAALMVRAEAIEAVGLLDEAYFMYAEEMDWQKRLQRAGWPMVCVPRARVTHYEGQSARQFRRAMTVALWRSRLRYYHQHHAPWKRNLERKLLAWALRGRIMRARKAADAEAIAAWEEILAFL
jgi:GT2 family glycosyltransferase